jgi:hypothetical protein
MGIVPQSLFKNLKILDLGNTLVVEIQKGILLYLCHIVRKFLKIDTEHNKAQLRPPRFIRDSSLIRPAAFLVLGIIFVL